MTEETYFKVWKEAKDTIEITILQFKTGDFTAKSADGSSTGPSDQIRELK